MRADPKTALKSLVLVSIALALLMFGAPAQLEFVALADEAGTSKPNAYAWHKGQIERRFESAILPPVGFQRTRVAPTSFGAWLRGLPMKANDAPVLLYTGDPKWRQDVHAGVIDIDVGTRDLQQCADAIMRLRAEWLWSQNRASEIGFNYTGGGRVPFSRWARGERPSESGKSWRKRGKRDSSYSSFRRYMIQVFAYAGTYSLSKELKRIDPQNIAIGDVFIKGGFPGHAVLVADMVENGSGEKRFLLVQSFMPAQDMHVLRNPADPAGSPWYSADISWPIATPEWTFQKGSLKRWSR